jgi:hypothetical protein
MSGVLRRLLLLPVLAPLMAVAALVLLNPRPAVALRLLTWTSPALPVGSWLAMAVAGGGLLSAAATTAALQATGHGRRQVGGQPEARTHEAPHRAPVWPEPSPAPASGAGPERPPGAPAPVVEVPFRVIRKGRGEAATPTAAATPPAPTAVANAVGDGWSDAPSDDW